MLLFSIRSNIEKGSRSFFSLRAKAYFNDQKNELNEIVGKEVTISVENSSRVSKSPRFFFSMALSLLQSSKARE